jgi:hypothetical protein
MKCNDDLLWWRSWREFDFRKIFKNITPKICIRSINCTGAHASCCTRWYSSTLWDMQPKMLCFGNMHSRVVPNFAYFEDMHIVKPFLKMHIYEICIITPSLNMQIHEICKVTEFSINVYPKQSQFQRRSTSALNTQYFGTAPHNCNLGQWSLTCRQSVGDFSVVHAVFYCSIWVPLAYSWQVSSATVLTYRYVKIVPCMQFPIVEIDTELLQSNCLRNCHYNHSSLSILPRPEVVEIANKMCRTKCIKKIMHQNTDFCLVDLLYLAGYYNSTPCIPGP